MDSSNFVAITVVLWVFTGITFLMTARTASYVLKLRALTDAAALAYKPSTAASLTLGAPAPDFAVDTLTRGRVLLSSLWGERGALVLFVLPNCEHCEWLLAKLWNTGLDLYPSLFIAAGGSRDRTTKWVQLFAEGDPQLLSRIITATDTSTRFHAIYNPQGLYPFFCSIDNHGILRSQGPAVGRNSEWVQELEALTIPTTRAT